MKRLLCIILCLVLVLSLCACGKDSSAGTNLSETGVSAGANTGNDEGPKFLNEDGTIIRPEFEGQTAQLESTVPFEGDFLKVAITSFKAQAEAIEFTVKVENTSDKNVYLPLGYIYINGLSIEKRYFKDIEQTYYLDAKESRELSFVCPTWILTENGISNIYTGELRFRAQQYVGKSNPIAECEGLVAFKTTEKGKQLNYTEGQTVYDKDGLRIVLQNTGWLNTASFGNIRVYVENNSDKSYKVFISEVNILPYGKYKEHWARGTSVSPEHSGYYTEWIETFTIRDSLPIQTISLTFEISRSDHLYSNNVWGATETFTVDLSDWDWSAITY